MIKTTFTREKNVESFIINIYLIIEYKNNLSILYKLII